MALHGSHARRNPTEALPPALVRDILLRLPADQLARAACVSRAWRAAVADPALWLRLDLSVKSGVRCWVDDDCVLAAAARARGGLVALDVSGQVQMWAALRAVAAANAASLRELRTVVAQEGNSGWRELEALLRAAPALHVLGADVRFCTCATARRMLRNEPPFGQLRLRSLLIDVDEPGLDLPGLAADLAGHPSLSVLQLQGDHQLLTLRDMDAFADAGLAVGLSALELFTSDLAPAVAPALARLLSSAALTRLHLTNMNPTAVALLDAPAAALLAPALRANRTLRSFRLCEVRLWADVQAGVDLVRALTGHASLHSLNLSFNVVGPALPATAALAALVAADAPALTELDLAQCDLHDAGVGALLDALRSNTHLRKLTLHGTRMSAAFAQQQLLPALRANSSLRELELGDEVEGADDALEQAMELVDAREAAPDGWD
jgi:hypothetical protein